MVSSDFLCCSVTVAHVQISFYFPLTTCYSATSRNVTALNFGCSNSETSKLSYFACLFLTVSVELGLGAPISFWPSGLCSRHLTSFSLVENGWETWKRILAELMSAHICFAAVATRERKRSQKPSFSSTGYILCQMVGVEAENKACMDLSYTPCLSKGTYKIYTDGTNHLMKNTAIYIICLLLYPRWILAHSHNT